MTANLATHQIFQQLEGKAADKNAIEVNHSLCKTVAVRIAPEVGDITQVLDPLVASGILEESDVTEFLNTQRTRLKNVAKANTERDREVNTFVQTLRTLRAQIGTAAAAGPTGTENEVNYQAKIQEIMEDTRGKIQPSNKYMEDILTKLGEDNGATDGDEDIQIMGGQQDENMSCPITQALYVEPMKSKVCGHVYSKEGILGLMGRHRMCQCPVAGCTNKSVTVQQLEKDIEKDLLVRRERRRLDLAKEQMASQAQSVDSDDDED